MLKPAYQLGLSKIRRLLTPANWFNAAFLRSHTTLFPLLPTFLSVILAGAASLFFSRLLKKP